MLTQTVQSTIASPTKRKKPELLAPAGNLEKLKFAVLYGADAVYIGGQKFGLRSKAGNFTYEDMKEGVAFAHAHGAKVFVAANIIAHNEDFEGMEEYFRTLYDIGIDAVIIADPAIVEVCKQAAPHLEIHLSTQASTTNWQAVSFWANEGISRVVLAREVSMEEIRQIKKYTDVEIEAFIHGAMCISYSGRCVLSNHMTNRDANRGGCAQSCRWKYDLFEEAEEEDTETPQIGKTELPMFSEEDDSFTMSSKDLCMIEHIPEMIEAGVDSLKIEGRMKTVHYVATVVNTYRKVIDAYCEDPEGFVFKPEWMDEILKAANRPVTTAFYYGSPTEQDQIFGVPPKMAKYDFAGLVLDYDEKTGIATIEQRNHFAVGSEVEFFGPKRDNFIQKVEELWDEEGNSLTEANRAMQKVKMRVTQPVKPYDIMRKEKK
ncbi:U32 family peptidase [Brevibacillus sp. SYP-B805]|uniref:peptidase U32 family protein n=1 Tax=Brevibacillus sp. SYP-B805 TaxID=1578199 RepID=UPI0013EC8383|nr:U32 family peptidase [Brevibacillus sp. SYP-B805]NGQ95887.1 U32 family peptidase [Brevibacillus sp. SYP-B805]